MEIKFLNASFETIYILDVFKSLIWTDRYNEVGDLDIAMAPTAAVLAALLDTAYFKLDESEHLMIYEHSQIHSDPEEGNELIIKGRSLESILDRRIVWTGTELVSNIQDACESLIIDHIQFPNDSTREITNFTFDLVTDPAVTGVNVNTQFFGETLLDAISQMCQAAEIGFKVVLTASHNFEFSLYAGVDRSYNQSTNTWIVFSTDLENLLNADYIETSKYEKTACLVAGEQGVGNARATIEVAAPGGTKTGLARKEMYLEASITRNLPGGGELTDAEYLDQLEGKGVEELAKNIYVTSFDGEVDTNMWNFGDDYQMGDILQIIDQYGHSTSSRVTEMIYSQDENGIKLYPTFTTTGT